MRTMLMALSTLLLLHGSLASQTRNEVRAGDTVFIKEKHVTRGAVVLFTGPSPCMPCLQSVVNIEESIAAVGLPFEIYIADGMESGAYSDFSKLVKYAKLLDDEIGSVRNLYRIVRFPYILVIAPSGVVRFAGHFAKAGFDSDEFFNAVDDLAAAGPFNNYRGPVAEQARVVRTIQVQSGSFGPSQIGQHPYTAFDSVTRQVFVWDFKGSTTAFVIDSMGSINRRVDMSRMFAECNSGTHLPRHWDARGNRLLGSNYDSRRNKYTLFWFDMTTMVIDTVPLVDHFWGRRRSTRFIYAPDTDSYVFGVKHANGLPGDPNPAATMYIHTPVLDTFFGKRSDFYDSMEFPDGLQVVQFGAYRDGWIATQMFTDTLLIVNGKDLSTTALHVPIPERYRVPFDSAMRAWAKDPEVAQMNSARFSVLKDILHDPVSDRLALVYLVPSQILQGRSYDPPDQYSTIVSFYDVAARKVISTFEIPLGTVPIAAHSERILCSQLGMVPAQLTWFAAPVQRLKSVSTGER